MTGTGREESRKSIDLGQPDLPQDDIIDEVSSMTVAISSFTGLLIFTMQIYFVWPSGQLWPPHSETGSNVTGWQTLLCLCLFQRVISKDGNILSKAPSGMQSGGEEEQDEEAHTPLPPPMEIIKDPSAQDEKVGWGR